MDAELDLPLSANIKDVLVEHYIIQWNLYGSSHDVTMFLKPPDEDQRKSTEERTLPAESSNSTEIFKLILDLCDINVLSVKEINSDTNILIPGNFLDKKADIKNKNGVYMKSLQLETVQVLQFKVYKHSIEIWKPGVFSLSTFPKVIQINYEMKQISPSFKWTLDQDQRSCGFTCGHWVNNRSLFPSQDVPTAMATWQAVIGVLDGYTPLMTGDRNPEILEDYCSDAYRYYFFYSTLPMPTSTLALAVGQWKEITVIKDTGLEPFSCSSHGEQCHVNFTSNDCIPCRLFLPHCLEHRASELVTYLQKSMNSVKKILGPHPFQKVDVLIVPSCFDSLGMASPSLLFLSQSIFVGDYSMCPRVSHELCHSWFGLIIGPKDWTEEWLTEGFCTYLEDIVHVQAMEWEDVKSKEYIDLRAHLRYRTLVNELANTNTDLQVLRPNCSNDNNDDSLNFVKNGMNPDKAFMQVHYLKGYFLLRYLEDAVGRQEFLQFFRNYVIKFHSKLVSAKDFVEFFFDSFSHLKSNQETISRKWLDSTDLPQEVMDLQDKIQSENRLVKTVYQEVEMINTGINKCKKRRQRENFIKSHIEMGTDEQVLFLELLLEKERLSEAMFTKIKQQYTITNKNPEVFHRICELIIKHKYKKYYDDVEDFLMNHQAMGVYLYGEITLSGNKNLIQLAEKCFNVLKKDMPEGALKTIQSMLYGN